LDEGSGLKRSTQTQKTIIYTFVLRKGIEPANQVFKGAKTFRVLDRAVNVIGLIKR
jgi:hypothetical protein